MIHSSKKAVGTVFYVPNDEEGLAFLRQCEKYRNRAHYKMRVRGRNENRKQHREAAGRGLNQDLPLKYASYLAVYFPSTAFDKAYKMLRELQQESIVLQTQLLELKREKKQVLAEQAADLQKSVEKLMVRFEKRKIRV
jgi:hypothetical protein